MPRIIRRAVAGVTTSLQEVRGGNVDDERGEEVKEGAAFVEFGDEPELQLRARVLVVVRDVAQDVDVSNVGVRVDLHFSVPATLSLPRSSEETNQLRSSLLGKIFTATRSPFHMPT